MKSPKIIYLVTRTHGLKQHLFKSSDFISMLRAKNILEISDLLFRSDYGTELSKIPIKELDAQQLEKIFYKKLSERFSFLFQITSGKVKEVLEAYFRKIEVENIKRIIRAIHGKERITEDNIIPIPRRYLSVNFSALVETRTIREMIDFLKESPYRNLKNAVEHYEKYSNPLVLEAQADKLYYRSLWETLQETADKDEIKQLIGTEIDLRNLLYIFSFKHMKMEPELLKEMIINIHYKLPKSVIPQLIDAPSETIPSLLTWPPYSELAKKTVEFLDKGMLAETENIFLQHLYSCAETLALRNPNSLVYVFAYLNLCFREARNLTTVAVGKQLKLEERKIRGSIFL